MKYIIFFAMIFVFIACQRYWYVEVIVENNTGYNIMIEAFYEGVELEVISIKPFESYTQPQYFHPEDSPGFQLFQDYPIDSINILFDNDKIIVQSCEESELALCSDVGKNILNYGIYYEHEDIGRKEFHLVYTITEEDYERAVPIEN